MPHLRRRPNTGDVDIAPGRLGRRAGQECSQNEARRPVTKLPATNDDTAMRFGDDVAVQRAAAMDPATPPKTLAKLANNPDMAPVVAGNPNASAELLMTLAADHPREFLDNPALPFLLLEAPDLPQRMSRAAAAAVARFADVPLVILKQFSASDDTLIAELGRTHVQITGEQLYGDGGAVTTTPTRRPLMPTISMETHMALNRIICLTADGQKDWLRLPNLYPHWFLDILAATDSFREAAEQCPDAINALRWNSPYDSSAPTAYATPALHNLAESRPLSSEEFTRLATDPQFELRVALARRDDTPANIRAILARDKDVRIQHAVAIHPQTPPRLLETLATDKSYRVRYGVALNPNTPPRTLQRLASDRDHQVRAMVARNPSTPSATLDGFLRDDDHVRVSLARNPACPQYLLVRLLGDANDDVRCAALKRINPTAREVDLAAIMTDERMRVIIAANPRLPTAILTQLAQSLTPALPGQYDRRLARAVAGNPATPAAALDQLARIPDAETQSLVAKHAQTTPTTLAWLCANVCVYVALSVNLARNPATPADALEHLAATSDYAVAQALITRLNLPPDGRAHIYRRILRYNLTAQHPPFASAWYGASGQRVAPETNRFLCLVALASNLLDEADYARGVVSPLWSERYVLARNPAAPRALVEALTHDGHSYVRAMARMNLTERDKHEPGRAP